jgi:hypothetical protein
MIYDPRSGTYFQPDDAACVYTYNGPGGAVDTATLTYNGGMWRKTYTYTGNLLTSETGWVKQ